MTPEELIDLADQVRKDYPQWMQYLDFTAMTLLLHFPDEENEQWIPVDQLLKKEEKGMV
jgi:hypothetical protein